MTSFLLQRWQNLGKSKYILVVWLLLLVLWICSCVIVTEDYRTTYFGYQIWPTAKTMSVIFYAVAALPQLLAAIFFFLGMQYKSRGMVVVSFVMAAVDGMFDIYYKAHFPDPAIFSWLSFGASIPETIVIYTIGSEFLFTFGLSELLQMFPSFIEQCRSLKYEIEQAKKAADLARRQDHNQGNHYRPIPQPSLLNQNKRDFFERKEPSYTPHNQSRREYRQQGGRK